MANTINWGQAAVENTIDYGQGATDNTISWGKSQTLSPSGETNITGAGGTPAFTNTLSTLFDGTDDYVDCGSTSYLQNLSEFSVSLWAKQTTAARTECIIGDWGFDTDGNFAIETGLLSGSATKLTFYIKELSGTVRSIQTQNYVFTENVWNHIAITFNSGTPNIYVNGTAQGLNVPSLPTSLAYGNGTINIGRFRGLGRNFNGTIDEVSVFNTELSQTNITDIYNLGTPTDISAMSGLVSWWRMGDGSTYPTINDAAGSNNGTMTNMSSANFVTDVPT